MRPGRVLEAARWVGRFLPFNRRVRLIARLLPRRMWYRAALAASRHHGRLASLAGANGRLTEAIMLDHWLRQLTVSGAFPIPWIMRDRSGLDAPDAQRGILFCWIHTPLFEIPLHAFVSLGYPTPAVVADHGNTSGLREFSILGTTQRTEAIPADARGLLRMRTILRQGGRVVCLADELIGGPLSPHAMKLAGRLGARVVFPWAERRPDGVIDISIVQPPCPACANHAEIEANLHFLETERRRLLAS